MDANTLNFILGIAGIFLAVVGIVVGIIGSIASCFSIYYYKLNMDDNFKRFIWEGIVAMLSFEQNSNSSIFTETFRNWQMIFVTKCYRRFTQTQREESQKVWQIMERAQASLDPNIISNNSRQIALDMIRDYLVWKGWRI